jgi:hypothetical protein
LDIESWFEEDDGSDEIVLDYYSDSDYENWQMYPATTTTSSTTTTVPPTTNFEMETRATLTTEKTFRMETTTTTKTDVGNDEHGENF